MPANALFAYGTLQIPEVMEAVTGQLFPSQEATAREFVRYVLNDKIYPGIVSQSGATTDGRMYLNMNEQALTFLDKFEDELYVRELIEISLSTGEHVEAFAYLIPEQYRDVLSRQCWDKDEFMLKHFATYIESCRAFHHETMQRFES